MKKQDAAVEAIEEYIIKYALKPHDRLPSERQMEELFGFKRTTLRTAIRYLVLTGVLYSKQGSGNYIAPKKLVKNLQDAKGTYAFAKESGKELSSKVLDFKKLPAGKAIAKKMLIDEAEDVYRLERIRYLDSIPVTYSIVYLRAKSFKNLENFDFSNLSLYETIEKCYSTKISEGEETLNIAYSDQYESNLLEIPLKSPLIYQSGISKDGKGTVIEVFKELTRSEYIVFTSVLKRFDKGDSDIINEAVKNQELC